MACECKVLDRPSQPTLAIRTRSAVQGLPQVLGQAWGAIMQYAGPMGIQPSGPPFVAYHNMDMQDLDLEIGFPFAESVKGEGEVRAGEIPGGKAATCLHVGPYDQIAVAYEALGKWMQENNHTPSGVAYEFYLNDLQVTPPDELETEVVFPLA
jgi:effector-binding domain-containing protein